MNRQQDFQQIRTGQGMDAPVLLRGSNERAYMGGAWLLTFLIVSLTGIVLLYKLISRHRAFSAPISALDTAKVRFAKGDITKAELETIKKELAD